MRERTISTQAIDQIGQVRFRDLLCGHNSERAAYNQVLLETRECIVAPTLGSIVPNWLLIVPRCPVVSFRKWQAITRMDPVWLIGEILAELEIEAERTIWFEHGPSAEGSPVGCGVDHAHLHVIVDAPFSFEQFAASGVENARVGWRWSSSREAYDSISAGGSYLVGGSADKAVLAESVESVGSQFYRRVVAQLAGKPHQWDYKAHQHLENVQRTVSAFNSRRALAAVL
jgi:diadenosine tetraphosphate (Ap4A) HIT family hydrolase